jgi:putative endonuclease
LKRDGYKVLARNLRFQHGEIDLVVEDGATGQLAVVEVKSGVSEDPPPERHVNHVKRRKLISLARQMIKRFGLQDRSVRFDVVGVVWPADQKRPTRVTHHVDAFRSQ